MSREGEGKERYPSNCEYKFRVLFSLPAPSWSAGGRSPATNFGFADRDKTGIFIRRKPPRVAEFLIFALKTRPVLAFRRGSLDALTNGQ